MIKILATLVVVMGLATCGSPAYANHGDVSGDINTVVRINAYCKTVEDVKKLQAAFDTQDQEKIKAFYFASDNTCIHMAMSSVTRGKTLPALVVEVVGTIELPLTGYTVDIVKVKLPSGKSVYTWHYSEKRQEI